MTTSRKTSLIGLGIVIVVFFALVIYLLISGIQKESRSFISQKNELARLEKKIQNLKNFQRFYPTYQANLGKIEGLFVDSSEPLNFIEFLEKEAQNANLEIEILPFAPQKVKGDPWPSMNFRLSLTGNFPDFLKFMEKLESAPYLVEVLNLSAVKAEEDKSGEVITLLIKVYTK